jgi:hypothetical protein
LADFLNDSLEELDLVGVKQGLGDSGGLGI